jgi:hypothetical protein
MADLMVDAIRITVRKRHDDRGEAVNIETHDDSVDLRLSAREIVLEDHRIEAPRLHENQAEEVDLVQRADLIQRMQEDDGNNTDLLMVEAAEALRQDIPSIDWLRRVDAALLATEIVPVATAEKPNGMDRVESIEHLALELRKEREWVGHLEQGIRDDAERLGIDTRGCVGLAIAHLVVEAVEKIRADAWGLIHRLEKEPRFKTIDEPGWMETLKSIAGPTDPTENEEQPGEESGG